MQRNNQDFHREFALERIFYGRDVEKLKLELKANGVISLKGFLSESSRALLAAEADDLLKKHGKKVDVLVPSTGNTPRKYTSVSRNDVFDYAPLISELYSNKEIINVIKALSGSDVIACPYEPEQIVVNRMDSVGDTHGWHWDDYTFSFVMVLETPDSQSGGQVEYIGGTSWDKKSANVQHYLDTMKLSCLDLSPGSAYILLGKKVMHRVSPLKIKETRKIICFSYALPEEKFAKIDHGSMESIYG